MNPTFACFVTGIDTDIGKTLVSCGMLRALARKSIRCAGMKPVAAGATLRDGVWHNDDVDALAAASSVVLPRELAAPYLLRTPASPHIAAAMDDVTINPNHILACYRKIHDHDHADAIVVEGVGGFRVPLTDRYTVTDMAVQFGLPIVLVVGMRLGCINHALLTAEAIISRGLTLAGWVANTIDADMPYLSVNVSTLRSMLPAPLLGIIPRLPEASAAMVANLLDFSELPGWPGNEKY